MSDDKKVFCTQCGNANDASAKFCCNCGNKLEKPVDQEEVTTQSGQENVQGGIFTGEQVYPAYEKVEAEVVSEGNSQPMQGDININYGASEGSYDNKISYSTPEPQYYSDTQTAEQKQGNGNIGFAIASLACGILSILCCCFTVFSVIMGVAAVVLGIICICFKYDGKGLAIAGIITGGLGLVIWLFAIILGASGLVYDLMDELSYY